MVSVRSLHKSKIRFRAPANAAKGGQPARVKKQKPRTVETRSLRIGKKRNAAHGNAETACGGANKKRLTLVKNATYQHAIKAESADSPATGLTHDTPYPNGSSH